jgi:hypothetical protein
MRAVGLNRVESFSCEVEHCEFVILVTVAPTNALPLTISDVCEME